MPENEPLKVKQLIFDVDSGRLLTTLSDETAVQYTVRFDPFQITFDGRFRPSEAAARQEIVHQAPEPTPATPTPERPTGPEKQPVQTLTGRLVDDVKPGRHDSRGNPTSWAPALLHVDEEETAQRVAITFHRHTTQLALDNLHKNDQVTVQGYLRKASPPKPGETPRMDAFSAFHLINYPGKEKETP